MKIYEVFDEDWSEVMGPTQLTEFAKRQQEVLENDSKLRNKKINDIETAKKVLEERGFEVNEKEIY